MPSTYMTSCAMMDCRRFAKHRGMCLSHYRAWIHLQQHNHHHLDPHPVPTLYTSIARSVSPSIASSSSSGSSQMSPRSYRESLAKVLAERHRPKEPSDADDRGAARMATLKTRLILRERLRQREKGPVRC
ncbi:hypothetical protein H310_03526 [Aphanomyces invadans]|uniref:Uncharacterized protein n=1 Tax=Aphanomyces invadans TaxID=157072 RepID=A0A024UJS8_9STRA|nr:hypothetical protein H310_03526 [Aphanomyces invadans]ETW05868.1 hypothetical protein H310_03526 [Aphanomyces invadans]|eukprot:XP_008865645.1 hypothetical protein H310_03526 [Aphanomyces invadans]